MFLDIVYGLSPIAIQNTICTLYGWKENKTRFNDDFQKILAELLNNEYLSEELIYDIQKNKLIEILISGKDSGFYKKLGLVDELQIRDAPFDVLSSLPIINKETIRSWSEKLEYKKGLVSFTTSGTTGNALTLWKSKYSVAFQWAVWFRHRKRFGVNLGDVSVNFTGKPVVPSKQRKPPFWRLNKAQNQYLVGMQHINSSTIHSIVSFLGEIRPVFYSGYPSIIAELARLALDNGLVLPERAKPRVIFMGAEKTLDYQRDSIVSWLGENTIITDQYGLSEGNCNFSKCEYGQYHEDFEFAYSEVIESKLDGDQDKMGRLIGTSLVNKAFPLIRYDTGDLATDNNSKAKCACGRQSKIIKDIAGRKDDYITLPDGKRIMRVDYLFKNTTEAFEAQVLQTLHGEITVLAVLRGGSNKEVFEKKVDTNFRKYIHPTMLINFDYTDKIERSSNGKFKAIVNNLKQTEK